MADNMRILLVEDDVLIGMMLADMFDALGLPEPAQAASRDEALAIIATESLGRKGLAGRGRAGRAWDSLCVYVGRR
jgi:CheY-like chemotaxis protein